MSCNPPTTKQLWINHVITYNYTLPSSWRLFLSMRFVKTSLAYIVVLPDTRFCSPVFSRCNSMVVTFKHVFLCTEIPRAWKWAVFFFPFYFQLLDTGSITSLLWFSHFSLCSWVRSLQFCTTVLYILSIINDWLELCVCLCLCVCACIFGPCSEFKNSGAMELRVGNKYRLGRKIGSGSFGDIYLGEISFFLIMSFIQQIVIRVFD